MMPTLIREIITIEKYNNPMPAREDVNIYETKRRQTIKNKQRGTLFSTEFLSSTTIAKKTNKYIKNKTTPPVISISKMILCG